VKTACRLGLDISKSLPTTRYTDVMCNQYKPAPKERANTVNLTAISTETYQYEIKCQIWFNVNGLSWIYHWIYQPSQCGPTTVVCYNTHYNTRTWVDLITFILMIICCWAAWRMRVYRLYWLSYIWRVP